MKNLFLLVIFLLASTVLFSQKISVGETTERIGGSRNNAFVVQIHQVSEKEVEREFRNYLRSSNAKVSRKRGELRGENANIPSISDRPINIYAKIKDVNNNSVELTVAFDLGGTFLSSGMHPSQTDRAKDILRNFSKDITANAFSQILRDEERSLSRQERAQSKAVREKDNLEKVNERMKRDIERNEKKIESLDKKIKDFEKDVKERKERIDRLKNETPRAS